MGALSICFAPGGYDKAKRPSARGQSERRVGSNIAGRQKEMFISAGENVYTAEIEQVLLSHPEVQDAAVLGVPDSKWRELGAAYLVARKQGRIAPEIILECGDTRLARYKVPNEICFPG